MLTLLAPEKKSVEVLAHSKRIFLYIHLRAIENLPSPNGVLELHLSHAKNNLTKLVDTYPSENIIDLSIFNEYKPTFSLMIEQDNIEDANIISDHPLLITLYDRIKVLVPSEAEEMQEEDFAIYEEQLIPIAQGHIDLLRLCTKKRELITFHCILYPLSMSQSSFISSCTTMWEIYALLPLLKDLSIYNVAYISFESIFNVRPNLIDVVDLLVADIYFESKVPNEHNQYEKVKLCTFDKFCQQQLPENGLQLTWASLKREEPKNFDCIGIICGNYINMFNIFRKLVQTESSKINFEKVNLDHSVITSNSTHRFVLSEQFVRVLEDVIAFDEQQLLIELHLVDQPHQLIAQGRFDLSILLYPYGK
ncbi:uncharacterized protein LOC118755634 [Rhagoletis pomonella]|uniref:uncharacterized protein LOC118755634 n=1 Tax=Rhagoletis pomonella TaxID=28610 RepID=UPI001782C5F5|nr:uncharacterized protein LOC118755634 [Rhagoletis pomonella]